jgi:hypothetical protein
MAAAIATREEIAIGIHRVEDGLGKKRAQVNISLRGQKIMEALRSFLKARSPNLAISHRLNLKVSLAIPSSRFSINQLFHSTCLTAHQPLEQPAGGRSPKRHHQDANDLEAGDQRVGRNRFVAPAALQHSSPARVGSGSGAIR